MSNQIHPYNPDLSAHFVNLTLAAEAQSVWETDYSDHDSLENPFAVPLECYDKLFASAHMSGEAVKMDVDGPIQDEYELVGIMRFGEKLIPDYEELRDALSVWDAQDFDTIRKLMTSYSRRWSESITNTVRYNRANLLMGFALRSRDDGHGIIVTRGTMTTEEWLNNLNYRLTPFLPESQEFGTVHQGFRDIYKGLRGRYRELAAEFPVDKPLYLVGHSLGSAITSLAALDLAYCQPERASTIQAYLYAPPRTGDSAFTQIYDGQIGTSYRIVNVCDIVPYVPFEEISTFVDAFGYPYADTKGEVAFVHQMGNPIANHIASYHIATRDQVPGVMDVSQPRRISAG